MEKFKVSQSSVQTPKNKTKKPKHPPHKKTPQRRFRLLCDFTSLSQDCGGIHRYSSFRFVDICSCTVLNKVEV